MQNTETNAGTERSRIFRVHEARGSGRRQTRVAERYNARKLGWLHDSLHFIVLTMLLVVLFRFVIGVAAVGGDSMHPTLESGDLVVYLRIVPQLRPGDIVSLRVPAGDYYIKRVVAVGGDSVDLHDGQIFVNGEAEGGSFIHGATEEERGAVIYPYLVREGNVFVLGDNRGVSMDSRAFGEVNRRQIRGKILLRIGRGGIGLLGGKESAA